MAKKAKKAKKAKRARKASIQQTRPRRTTKTVALTSIRNQLKAKISAVENSLAAGRKTPKGPKRLKNMKRAMSLLSADCPNDMNVTFD